MGYKTEMMKELTDKLNNITENLENETDDDEIMTLLFQANVVREIIKKIIKGEPIAQYDSENKQAYILYSDGTKKIFSLDK